MCRSVDTYVCMYAYVYVCMYVCIRSEKIRTNACMRMCMYVCMYAYGVKVEMQEAVSKGHAPIKEVRMRPQETRVCGLKRLVYEVLRD